LGPIPNPQSPIPNPQSPKMIFMILLYFNLSLIKLQKERIINTNQK